MRLRDFILVEKIGWEKYPKGWTRQSVIKFAKSLAGKHATEKGFFDACVDKMSGNIDDPEAFCASVKDVAWKSTMWRGKGKTKEETKKAIAKEKGLEK